MSGTADEPLRTIRVSHGPLGTSITLARAERENAIDPTMLAELTSALRAADTDPECRLVVLSADGPVFCAGMDIASAATDRPAEDGGAAFFDLMAAMSGLSKVLVASVDGKVLGGGVGLVAACDLVWASPTTTFALPEMLWGLLPCCVLPFLIRRTGAQFARAMTLTTMPVDAARAAQHGLIDQVTDQPAALQRALGYRLSKIDPQTVRRGKRLLEELAGPDESTRALVLREFASLMGSDMVAGRMAGGATGWDGRR